MPSLALLKVLKNLVDGNIAYVLLLTLQKAFGIVGHDIYLSKLEHYSLRGALNKLFKS